jgi:hypothetical protein
MIWIVSAFVTNNFKIEQILSKLTFKNKYFLIYIKINFLRWIIILFYFK